MDLNVKTLELLAIANRHEDTLSVDPRKAYAMGILDAMMGYHELSLDEYIEMSNIIKQHTFEEN